MFIGSGISDPPTAVREQKYKVLNRSIHVPQLDDESGLQLEAYYSFADGEHLVFNYARAFNQLYQDYLYNEVFTYMFLHEGFLHILFNLLWLYWFGQVFIQELGLKKLLSTYLVGGMVGGLLFVLFYNIFPVFDPVKGSAIALGASASVMAVVVATAVYQPERRMHLILIGPVKIIYLALAMFILTSLVDFSVNTGGKIAHIGGAITGAVFAYYYRQGKDITKGFDRTMDKIATWFTPGKDRMKVTYRRTTEQKPPADDIRYNQQKIEEQKQIDQILEKISKAGYDSLSSKEKELLFRMSNKK